MRSVSCKPKSVTETHFSNQRVEQPTLIKSQRWERPALDPLCQHQITTKHSGEDLGPGGTPQMTQYFSRHAFSEALNIVATERKVSRTISCFNKYRIPSLLHSHPPHPCGCLHEHPPNVHNPLCIPHHTVHPVTDGTRLTFIFASQCSWFLICTQMFEKRKKGEDIWGLFFQLEEN